MKQRAEKMSQVVRKVVGEELIKVLPQAYVSGVEVSDDLRYATVWLDAISEDDIQTAKDDITEVQTHLQQAVAKYANSKFTPKLSFRFDQGSEHADHIDRLLAKIKKR